MSLAAGANRSLAYPSCPQMPSPERCCPAVPATETYGKAPASGGTGKIPVRVIQRSNEWTNDDRHSWYRIRARRFAAWPGWTRRAGWCSASACDGIGCRLSRPFVQRVPQPSSAGNSLGGVGVRSLSVPSSETAALSCLFFRRRASAAATSPSAVWRALGHGPVCARIVRRMVQGLGALSGRPFRAFGPIRSDRS